MKFGEWNTNVKAGIAILSLITTVSVGGVAWAFTTFTTKAEFQEHVVTQLCSKAISDYLRAKELTTIHPEDKSRQLELEIALEMVNRVCPPAKGSNV